MNLPLWAMLAVLKVQGRRKRFETVEGLHRAVTEDRLQSNGAPPADVAKQFRIETRLYSGQRCYSIGPVDGPGSVHVLYFHGGAYVAEMTSHHWRFLAKLVQRIGCVAHVPIYPLAPEHTHKPAWEMAMAVYARLSAEHGPQNVVLMGDSSGGGLALALAQSVAAEGHPNPRRVVLISPWLDLSMSNPGITELLSNDPWLDIPGLLAAGQWWAGGLPVGHPRVSPVNGAFSGLAPVAIFIGGRDIFLPDCRLAKTRASEAGAQCELLIEADMIHVWPLLPLAKAQTAVERICEMVA